MWDRSRAFQARERANCYLLRLVRFGTPRHSPRSIGRYQAELHSIELSAVLAHEDLALLLSVSCEHFALSGLYAPFWNARSVATAPVTCGWHELALLQNLIDPDAGFLTASAPSRKIVCVKHESSEPGRIRLADPLAMRAMNFVFVLSLHLSLPGAKSASDRRCSG